MSEGSEQSSNKITRRDFLKQLRDKSLQAGAAMLVASTVGRAQSSNESNTLTNAEIYKHKVNDTDLYFSQHRSKSIKPLMYSNTTYFDLSSKRMIPTTQCTPDMLLVGNNPAFLDGRDITVTPEFVNSDVIKKIIDGGNSNVEKWVDRLSKEQKTISTSGDFGNNNPDISIDTNESINFTPSQLLKLRQFVNAISDVLNYDRYSPEQFKDLPLTDRLAAGYTNCQEFTLATAVVLAGEPLNIPSEILRFEYEVPWSMEDGVKIDKPKIQAHVCNVINFNNTPVIIDTTAFGNGIRTLSDYFRQYSKNGINITSQIQYSSILSEDSYQQFPWNDSEWINARTSLGITEASKSA